MAKNILIDFEKIKDPFSGLGQVCLHLKKQFDQSSLPIKYWTPGKFGKLAKYIPALLPKSDLFHAIHQDSPYLPKDEKTKFILTVHDLNYIYQRKDRPKKVEKYKTDLQAKIDRAEVVTFISEFARTDVFNNFNLDLKKTQVIYNGISLGTEEKKPDFIPTKKFLFTVGTVLPKKNFHVLVEMMKYLPDYQLVIAGINHSDYAKKIQEDIVKNQQKEQIKLVGTIEEANKVWYYKNASAFVFPSLFEGFGLPIAEAMSLGLPLFLSKKTSIPEIGGEEAYYFDHFEAEYMAQVIQKGISEFNEEKRQRLIERSKLFSWKEAAKAYLALYARFL